MSPALLGSRALAELAELGVQPATAGHLPQSVKGAHYCARRGGHAHGDPVPAGHAVPDAGLRRTVRCQLSSQNAAARSCVLPHRTRPMLALVALFTLAVIAFGRWQGIRSLVGLASSLAVILGFVIPAIVPPATYSRGIVPVLLPAPYCAPWPSTAGSRRAATGACRDPKTCRQTVTDHDHRSAQRKVAYLGFLTGSHGPQCLGIPPRNATLDLTRKRSQVQTLSRPPVRP